MYQTIVGLSAVANEFGNCKADYMAASAFPEIKVCGKQFQSLVFQKGDAFRTANDLVGPASQVHEVGQYGTLTTPQLLETHALDYPIPAEDETEASYGCGPVYDRTIGATKFLTGLLLNNYDFEIGSLLSTASTYLAANQITLSGTNQFNNSTAPVLQQIQQYMLQIVPRPNVIIMGRDVADALARHPDIRGNFFGQGGGVVSQDILAEQLKNIFGVKKVVIANAFINTAGVGLAPTYVQMFSKKMALLSIDADMPATDCPSSSFGYTAVLQQGVLVREIKEEKAMGAWGGKYIRAIHMRKPVILDNSLGLLINNAIA